MKSPAIKGLTAWAWLMLCFMLVQESLTPGVTAKECVSSFVLLFGLLVLLVEKAAARGEEGK